MSVEDTSQRDALLHLAGSMGPQGFSGYVEEMEVAGQAQLVNSAVLPANAVRAYTSDGACEGVDGWEALTALGIRRGPPVDGDDLFVHVDLPAGWSRHPCEHSMWSEIRDELGVPRVSIFYKAAFYDRRASCRTVDPGATYASRAIYGTGPAELPDTWAVLTDAERDSFRDELRDYLTHAADHPNIYGDRVGRVEQLLTLADR